MKFFKFFLFIAFFTSLYFSIFSYISASSTAKINPTSDKNNFYLQLEHALETAQIKTFQDIIKDYENQLEFYIINESNSSTKVILSTQKNPYWQIASLQEIFKTAKINNKQLQLVDLSINHPYATFKNN